MRLVARALAGADHFEAGGARPVDMLADQGRLVAPGQRIDDARRLGLARQQGAGDGIGFHIDHDDVLAVLDGGERVMNASAGHAGRFDNDLNARIGDHRVGIGGDEGGAALVRVIERGGGIKLGRPAGGVQLAARAADIEIGDGDDMRTRGQPRLRQIHGAEFTGAYDADGDRFAGGFAIEKLGVQIHRRRTP